ncbi:MAG TPA: LacI family transcriptional regulator, partial [Planctomycetaceae bacterium]|nr:LacI family transcriptional regulator [Planctomycetaceae bacterium]
YNVILCNSDYNLERERAYIEVLQAKQVDGLIFIPSSIEIAHVRELLAKMRGPVVTADRYTPELAADSIIADNRAGGRLAAQHLLALGHQRIGCIERPKYLPHVQDRLIGFREVLEEQGIVIPDELCVRGGFSFEDGVRAARRLLSLPNPPTAVFAYNDIMAIGALRAAREMGLHVPDDLAVVGFDNIPVASFVTPQLTTIDQPKYRIGALAVELLIGRLSGEIEGDPQQQVLDVRLIVRESSDPARRIGSREAKTD